MLLVHWENKKKNLVTLNNVLRHLCDFSPKKCPCVFPNRIYVRYSYSASSQLLSFKLFYTQTHSTLKSARENVVRFGFVTY